MWFSTQMDLCKWTPRQSINQQFQTFGPNVTQTTDAFHLAFSTFPTQMDRKMSCFYRNHLKNFWNDSSTWCSKTILVLSSPWTIPFCKIAFIWKQHIFEFRKVAIILCNPHVYIFFVNLYNKALILFYSIFHSCHLSNILNTSFHKS